MDCRSFKEYLDSYFCEELAVETNHAMLRHAEHCPPCRCEMAARRELRVKLRRACLREAMGVEARDRLRMRLHAEARALCPASRASWREWLGGGLRLRLAGAAFAVALVILAVVGGAALLRARNARNENAPELTAALMGQAVDDHRTCAPKFKDAVEAVGFLPAEADPAYQGLEQVAARGAAGMRLCSAHMCAVDGRSFAHLVYRSGPRMVSLLVTSRDAQAVRDADALSHEVKTVVSGGAQDAWSLGVCQTPRHVVLVVSDLPMPDNTALAERLALPVADHLRRYERVATARAGLSTGRSSNQVIASVEKEEKHR